MVFLYMAPGVNDMNLGRGGKGANFSRSAAAAFQQPVRQTTD
jgi:hypothetical protein